MTKSAQSHMEPMKLEAEYDYVSGIRTEDTNFSSLSSVLLFLAVIGACTS